MLAEPRLIIAAAIQPLDEIEIALQCERWVDTGLMEGREKNAEAQPLAHWGRSSAFMWGLRWPPDRIKLALHPRFPDRGLDRHDNRSLQRTARRCYLPAPGKEYVRSSPDSRP